MRKCFLLEDGCFKSNFQFSFIIIINFQQTRFIRMDFDADTNFNYYHEYCRLYLANVVLLSQMRELVNERNELSSKFSKLQKKGEEIQQGERNDSDRKKRFRRTANEIERHYRCPVETCQRSYGSEGSLNQHLKLKHYEIYQQMNLGRSEIAEDSVGTQSLISRKKLH